MPNLTQEQKDQLIAELGKAGTVPEFDKVLDKAKVLNATQVSEGDRVVEDEAKPGQGEGAKPSQPATEQQGQRLPDTATDAWALGLVGLMSVGLGSALGFKRKKEDEE